MDLNIGVVRICIGLIIIVIVGLFRVQSDFFVAEHLYALVAFNQFIEPNVKLVVCTDKLVMLKMFVFELLKVKNLTLQFC